MIPDHIIVQLKGYDVTASPGPWTAVGHELYYGKEGKDVTHQQLARAEDARLIAVMRSWITDLIAEYEDMKYVLEKQ